DALPIWDDEDVFFLQHLHGLGARGAVGALGDDPGVDAVGVVAGDHAIDGRGDEDVDVELEQVLVGDRVAALVAADAAAVLVGVALEVRNVDAVGVVHAAGVVCDGDDLHAAVIELLGRHAADLAEALDGGRGGA